MTKGQKRDIVKSIKFHKDEIAKHRDSLRAIYSELGDVLESTERGVEALEEAIDTLSENL